MGLVRMLKFKVGDRVMYSGCMIDRDCPCGVGNACGQPIGKMPPYVAVVYSISPGPYDYTLEGAIGTLGVNECRMRPFQQKKLNHVNKLKELDETSVRLSNEAL